jgi:hypothetical protein
MSKGKFFDLDDDDELLLNSGSGAWGRAPAGRGRAFPVLQMQRSRPRPWPPCSRAIRCSSAIEQHLWHPCQHHGQVNASSRAAEKEPGQKLRSEIKSLNENMKNYFNNLHGNIWFDGFTNAQCSTKHKREEK